jgi:hypothetical protein
MFNNLSFEYIKKLVVEAIVVGITFGAFATLISYLYAKFTDKDTKFLKNKGMYLTLFVSGFLYHIICDITGVNKWYCNNCAGCK